MRSHHSVPPSDESPARHQQRRRSRDSGLPVSIPVVVAEAGADGRLTVTVDGALFTPEPIGRTAFGSLLDEIIRKRATALRVQVRESDGTIYTDLLTPPAAEAPTTSKARPSAREVDTTGRPGLLEVTGEGFVPGEDVAVAPILIHSSARADGQVRSLVEVDSSVAELLVFGRISGTVHVVGPRP